MLTTFDGGTSSFTITETGAAISSNIPATPSWTIAGGGPSGSIVVDGNQIGGPEVEEIGLDTALGHLIYIDFDLTTPATTEVEASANGSVFGGNGWTTDASLLHTACAAIAVPEPSGFLFFGLLGCLVGGVRRWRTWKSLS